MKGLRTGPPVTTLLTPLPSPLAVLPPTQTPRNPIPDESVRLNGPEWGYAGPSPPGASDTAEPRSSTRRPSRRNPPCPVLCRAGLACVLDGCWMLDAGARWDADCLGQGIRVGSWLADLSCCCTYNHVPPNFLNKTPPSVCLLLLASARFSYSKLRPSLPATHHHCLRASWAPILLFPVSLPGTIPLEHATCCLFCTTHHLTTLASHQISYPELPVVAPPL